MNFQASRREGNGSRSDPFPKQKGGSQVALVQNIKWLVDRAVAQALGHLFFS